MTDADHHPAADPLAHPEPDPECRAPTPRPITQALDAWFRSAARPFPWRPNPVDAPRDPWHALVSELMLQQTQASRVAERFPAFIEKFPTPQAMAAADEAAVLAAWSGLGFYRRARLLHAAARAITQQHQGTVPSSHEELLALPGVGRYTAGAIASIVFGQPTPIVDGNVSRVLLRLHNRDGAAGERATDTWAWEHAEHIAHAAAAPGVANEALMELGATVCTPRNPKCGECPLAAHCQAHRQGTTESIPRPKQRAKVKPIWAAAIVSLDRRGRILLEQRPDTGMWSGMWQLPTLETHDHSAGAAEVRAFAQARAVQPLETFIHQTTHRTFHFAIWLGEGMVARNGRVRKAASELGTLGLSAPQAAVIQRALAGEFPNA